MNKSNKSYELRLRDLPEEEKPREKLRKYGPTSLKNYELMAVILGKGRRKAFSSCPRGLCPNMAIRRSFPRVMWIPWRRS
jgi:hypothetical protein